MLLLDICISIFDFYIFTSFYRTIFYRKELWGDNKKCRYLVLATACSILAGGAVICRHIINAPHYVLMCFTFGFLICLSQLYQAKNKDRVFYSFILILLGCGSELFVGFYFVDLMNSILPSISAIDSNYLYGTVCSKLFYFLLSRFLSIICRKDKKTIPLVYWIILVLVPAVSIFELHTAVLYTTESSSAIYNKALIVISGIIIINILVFLIYDIVSYQFEKAIQRERQLTFLEKTQKRYELLVRHGQEMAGLLHDSEKHLSTIGGLINNNEIDDCLAYINELGIKYSQSIAYERILPENQAASIVLDTKRKEAISYGIEVEYKIDVSHKIPVDDTDLCMIFVNAFDNAIRACKEYDGSKKISLEIHQTYNRLVIQLQNTSNPVSIEWNGLCKTTKKDTLRHGFGLSNIQSIVNSIDGNMQVIYKDDMFTLKILLFL